AIEVRVMEHEGYLQGKARIDGLCARHDLVYKERIYGKPVVTDLSNPFVQNYMDSVEAVTGVRPRGCVSFAASDAIYINNVHIPCIISCPEGGRHHSE